MKIEKLSENSIRCTLNRADLTSRQLKISELAYGSEKAKNLFREMMQQASYEFGFEVEDAPLMVEAIPMSPDCIVLIITKVDDPDELDTRFSKFAPFSQDEDDDYDSDDSSDDDMAPKPTGAGADDILNLFNKVKNYLDKSLNDAMSATPSDDEPHFVPITKANNSKNDLPSNHDDSMEQALLENLDKMESIDGTPKETVESDPFEINMVKLFSFSSLKNVSKVAAIVANMYDGENSLFLDKASNRYYLQICKSDCEPLIYNKVCNIISEYGNRETTSYARQAFFEENCTTIIKNNALQILASL